jgi:hypothetical protein
MAVVLAMARIALSILAFALIIVAYSVFTPALIAVADSLLKFALIVVLTSSFLLILARSSADAALLQLRGKPLACLSGGLDIRRQAIVIFCPRPSCGRT